MVGGVASAVVNFWLLAGQIIYKTNVSKLPVPTGACFATNVDNITHIYETTEAIFQTPWTTTLEPYIEPDVNRSVEPNPNLFYIKQIYSNMYSC